MIVRPSVILFSEKSATEEAKKKENAKPLPDALVIDKEGARVLTLPKTPEATAPVPLQNVATTPVDNDGAPVDKLLMQRGFSHAFDQMLQNPAGGGAP